MSKKSAFGIATSRRQAEQTVDLPKSAHFANCDNSALFADKGTGHDFAREKRSKAPTRAVIGGSTGGLVGGALGGIAGMGALTIPGAGPFIAAGPIIAALSGAAIGAILGSIAGGLVGPGNPELEARRYEGKIKNGNIPISIHTGNSMEITEAEDICSTGESSTPEPDKPSVRNAHPAVYTGWR